MPQALSYYIDIKGTRHRLRRVEGEEQISQCFRFEISWNSDDESVHQADALIKEPVSLVLARDSEERRIPAVVTDAEVSLSISGEPKVRLVIEPKMALARYRRDLRVFRDQTAIQSAVDVLSQLDITPTLRLEQNYPTREYCVQFRETDLAFVERMLEEEGVFYYFAEDGTLIFGDSPSAIDDISGETIVPVRQAVSMDENEDALFDIGSHTKLSVGKVTLRDWNPETPSLDMDVEAAGPSKAGPEYYDFPGQYAAPAAGQRIADMTAAAYASEASRLIAKSSCGRLRIGAHFEMSGAPDGIDDGKQLVTKLNHDWDQGRSGFVADCEMRDGRQRYLPPRLHPEPRLTNPMTAIVTGPDKEDIHTDAYGRVKIHFHWDRRQPFDDSCSHWVATVQDNTGHSSAIPRVGWEMLVHFQEGDPDRPVILGRVYNGADPFPAKLPDDKYKTSLKSLTSPTRKGTNEIRFEDLAGEEQIWVHAEKDQNVVVVNDKDEKTLFNEGITVRRDERTTIANNHTAKIDNDRASEVRGNQTWSVSGDRKRVVVGGDEGAISGDRTLEVGGDHIRKIGTEDGTMVDKDLTEQVGGVVQETSKQVNLMTSGGNMNVIVAGSVTETAGGEKTESAAEGRKETVGGQLVTRCERDMQTRVGRVRDTKVGGSYLVKAGKTIALTGAERLTASSASGSHDGGQSVTLKVGDTMVVLRDGLIDIIAPNSIAMKVTGSNQQGAGESTQI